MTPPEAFDSGASLISSGAPITPSLVINAMGVRLAWPAIGGATAVYAGWTSSATPVLGALTLYNSPAAGSHDQTMAEASAMYAHVVAVDARGNRTASSSGPYYFDGPQTPDLIADLTLAAGAWVDSGAKQVGQMATEARGPQKLYVGWNASLLRLRWQGFDVSSEGDLYLYLGTGGAGTTNLHNPYGADQNGVLPFAADYLVRVSGGITPTQLSFSGGTWIEQTEVDALRNGATIDLLLSFADLGIANPTSASLKLLGVASLPGELDVWATVPDRNLGQPWKQYVQFNSLGAGIMPAAGVWADAQLEVEVSSDPPPSQLVGVGDSIDVTVAAKNAGSAMLPSLTVSGMTAGGVSLTNAPQVAAGIAPSATVSLTLHGVVTADGSVTVTLADSYHRAYQLQTLAYAVDTSAPISVSLAISYLVPYTNTVIGFAQDDSPLGQFELQIDGTQTMLCDVAGSVPGSAVCEWNVGNAPNGATVSLQARATDIHGNVSAWSTPIPAVVDATPPQLTLAAATLAALDGGWLNASELALSGLLTDDRAPDRVDLCSDDPDTPCAFGNVLPDGSWTLQAPSLGDGVATTLTFTGYDLAGNASQAPRTVTVDVTVDMVAPQFGPTTLSQNVSASNSAQLLGSGTVTDGGGVAAVQVYVARPDASSAVVTATLGVDAGWSAQYVFDQVGQYQVLAVATDTAGNQAAQFAGLMTVASPLAVTLADFSAVQQGDRVLLSWETTSELNNLGFNLYRGVSAAGPDRQLNETLIPSQSPGSSGGASYTWEDRAEFAQGATYFYWIEDVDTSGAATRHGPVSVAYGAPTAVRLGGMEAKGAADGDALPLAIALPLALALLAGALLLRRRGRLA